MTETGTIPKVVTRTARLKALVAAYLVKHCLGKERRRPVRLVMAEIEIDPPLEDPREFHRVMQALRRDGLEIAAEDAGENPGIWIATDPDELDLTIYRLFYRALGIMNSVNLLLAVRFRKWPADAYPPKSERALRGEAKLMLPRYYEPGSHPGAGVPHQPMRGTRRTIGRQKTRYAGPTTEIHELVCPACRTVRPTSLTPSDFPTCEKGCRNEDGRPVVLEWPVNCGSPAPG